ncbi:hypothetical protein QJS10_CPB04g00604 [Acorus calamus]|uniref:Uncharacterized protein n=1 Tax=Acorus calamus TaxID=4465 RepID=A0AAV9EZU2_ACOCL|nr:hypothetical protein QJS10_CPB04g00604 [Acorus calamus]
MFRSIRKNLIPIVSRRRDSIETHLCIFQNPSLKSISTAPEANETPKASDFTDSALKASKGFRLRTTENPDSVHSLFKSYGFSDTQITKMISIRPHLLKCDPDQYVKPKMDFLRSVGFSATDLVFLLSVNPVIFSCSLSNQIEPTVGFLKGIVGTDKAVVLIAKRAPWLLNNDSQKSMGSNIRALRDYGVPDSKISAMFKWKPSIFLTQPNRFAEVSTKVKAMDFKPSSSLFYKALGSMLSLSKSTWEEKIEWYRSFGWSEDDFLSAFKKQPQIMNLSKDKIRKMMDFFLKEPGLELSSISSRPNLMLYSLEKTIIPRYSVINVLKSHGLLNKDVPEDGSSSVAGLPREDKD